MRIGSLIPNLVSFVCSGLFKFWFNLVSVLKIAPFLPASFGLPKLGLRLSLVLGFDIILD